MCKNQTDDKKTVVKTNRERINEMSDEEFVEFLASVEQEKIPICSPAICPVYGTPDPCDCRRAWARYLQLGVGEEL